MNMRFLDRVDAGRRLARRLVDLTGRPDLIVLGLPRGGVPVAREVARALRAPLDVLVVRKLGAPGQEELAMGAIATGGVRVLNDELVETLRITDEAIEEAAEREAHELDRRERAYRGDRPPLDLRDRTVILVDDGLATGSTMRAAIEAVRLQRPNRILVAVPTAAPSTCQAFRRIADDVICLITPEPFQAVGLWYEDFAQTTDEEVGELLANCDADRIPDGIVSR